MNKNNKLIYIIILWSLTVILSLFIGFFGGKMSIDSEYPVIDCIRSIEPHAYDIAKESDLTVESVREYIQYTCAIQYIDTSIEDPRTILKFNEG